MNLNHGPIVVILLIRSSIKCSRGIPKYGLHADMPLISPYLTLSGSRTTARLQSCLASFGIGPKWRRNVGSVRLKI